MSVAEIVTQGNPGAIKVLALTLNYDDNCFLLLCNHLLQQGIIGSRIWVLFKDTCKEDINVFMKIVWDYADVSEPILQSESV